jgi:hypothetical protein
MRVTRIYVLCDPDTGEVRYVGKTAMRLCNRLAKHMEANPKVYSGRWIGKLKAEGKRPIIRCIEEVGDNWAERECYWIAYYRSQGCQLTNVSPGGDGHNGHVTAISTRRKLSNARKGKKLPPDVIRKISESQKGKVITQEQRAKISASLKGRKRPREIAEKVAAIMRGKKKRPMTPEQKALISARNKGRKPTAEERAKMSAANRGKPKSEEHRRKLSEAAMNRVLSPERKKALSEAATLRNIRRKMNGHW